MENVVRMGMKLRISFELSVVLAQVQFPLHKQKESSEADNTDQAGSLLKRNAKSSCEKLTWPHFLKQKGYDQHSYLDCIKRGKEVIAYLKD